MASMMLSTEWSPTKCQSIEDGAGVDLPYKRMKRGKYELQWTSKAYILHRDYSVNVRIAQ